MNLADVLKTTIGGGLAVAALLLGAPQTAEACGGFFCAGGGGPQPVVQAAERVMFEKRDDGTIRAYVHIQYSQQSGAPVGFSWLIPTPQVPELGIADAMTFNDLDQATAPQFRFVGGGGPGGGGTSLGCGAIASSDSRGAETAPSDPDVMVWNESRIGDYITATIEGETSEAVLNWLEENGYDIPEEAGEAIDHYIYTGHVFSAFRYDPLEYTGVGNLDPVVLTYVGDKPCVPIKITAIASVPILDIMVMAFGDERAIPDPEGEYIEATPNYDAVRFDFSRPEQTDYKDYVDAAIQGVGGHAWVVEHAAPTSELVLADTEALGLASRNSYVTRFYTRMPPEAMDIDPEFVFEGGTDADARRNRLHIVDVSAPRPERMASPIALAAGVFSVLFWRRRRA